MSTRLTLDQRTQAGADDLASCRVVPGRDLFGDKAVQFLAK